MLNSYKEEASVRTADQTRGVTGLLEQGSKEGVLVVDLLSSRVEPGVSKAAKVKATWLEKVARQEV